MKLYIKYMVSNRCKMLVKEELKKLGLHATHVDLGEVEIEETISDQQQKQLSGALFNLDLELINDKKNISGKKSVLVERAKNVITQMIHYSDELPKKNFSHYISEKLNYDYTYVSNLFSETQGISIRQFIISHKIERIKELIMYNELNITEIAWKMNYSSVAHLSNQFKKITGFSPSHFKQLKEKNRNPIEEIGITREHNLVS